MGKLTNRESGFTLVEAIMALVILIIGATATWGLFVFGSRRNAESEDKTIATHIAQLKMEEILNHKYFYITTDYDTEIHYFSDAQPSEPPYWTQSTDGQWREALPNGNYQITFPNNVGGEDANPLRIRVTVSWKNAVYPESHVSLDTTVSLTPGRIGQS